MNAIEEKRKLKDKRKLKRFSDRLKISFNVNGIAYRGLSSNFSLNGLFIRTNHSFPPDTLLDITIYLPNDLTSHLKGKIVRASNETLLGVNGNARRYAEKGIGIEIIEKDALYLHFIRSFLSIEGTHIFRELAFTEQGEKYQKIEAELQKKCHLFEVVAVVIGEESKQAGFRRKAWFEAKIKNNTDYVFMHPIVTFMTTKDSEYAQKGKGNRPPEIATMLMSSSDNLSHWKPGETIILDGEIDLSSEDVPMYELNFFDYLTKTPEFAVDLPMSINDYVSTLWIGSPCLDEMGENIPDHVPFELLQPSLSVNKKESGINNSAKSDDTASKDLLLLPSPERVGQYNFFDNNFQHDETDEALNNIKISYPPAIGLKYEREASSQDEKNDNSFDGGHQITQETTNKILKEDKSMSSISRWIIFLGSIIIASLFILNLFIDKGYRPSFKRQSLVISSQKSIAPTNAGTERKEAIDQQQQKKQENRYSIETKTSQGNKQNTDLLQTGAIQQAPENKNLQNSQSNKRSRQNLSTTGRYSIQIGAFKNSSNAKARKANLHRKGYKTFLLTTNTKEHQNLFIVLVGKYGTREEAQLLLTKIENAEGLHAFVTDITNHEGDVNLRDRN
jgi:cell division septation protein DedD